MPALRAEKIQLHHKMPPHNLEAEQAVLGSILIDYESIYKIVEIVKSEDFYREAHAKVFGVMLELSQKNEPTDFLNVNNRLSENGLLEMVGGPSYLSGLADATPSSANVVSYAKIIREKSMIRRLISAATEVIEEGYQNVDGADSLMDKAEKLIFDITENRISPAFSKVKDVVRDSFKKIEELFESKKEITGIATGFKDLDKITSGLQKDDLIVLAARPSMGKTALALNLAENAALSEKKSVAIFSLEMSKESLVTRMLCSQARIDSSHLRRGALNERDWPLLTKAAGLLSDVNLFIDDTASPTVLEMRSKARRLAKEQGLDLIIVDYLQLARGISGSHSREQEISEISRSLKALAKELHVPVIALSQLNRALENRTNRRPQLSDLRESGAIEQDADVILFIYRDEVYDENTPDKGVAEIIIGKQRNGPTGTCRLAFLNQYTKFENLAFDNPTHDFEPPDEDEMY